MRKSAEDYENGPRISGLGGARNMIGFLYHVAYILQRTATPEAKRIRRAKLRPPMSVHPDQEVSTPIRPSLKRALLVRTARTITTPKSI